MADRKISVLVVDDSRFMRKAIERMLQSDPAIRIVGEAGDGLEAVEKVKLLKPDVVTLDIKMPGMDGLGALSMIMRERPTPVLVISSLTSEGAEITLTALDNGAVDFVDKSACRNMMDIGDIAGAVVAKVKAIAGLDMGKVSKAPRDISRPVSTAKRENRLGPEVPSHVVAIGASTGGPVSLESVLTALPADYDGAILVVQHMPIGFTKSLAERLNRICALDVREAAKGDRLSPGTVLIARSGFQMRFSRGSAGVVVALEACDQETIHCPSADVMMSSIADVWQGPLMGIVMTGMGDDGTEGIGRIKDAGGTTLAQDEASCIVFGMPKAAYESGRVDQLVPLSQLSRKIANFYAGLVLKSSSISPSR